MTEFHRLPPPGTDPANPLVGTWRHQSAVCDVTVLPTGVAYIAALEAGQQGAGHGSTLLALIARAADTLRLPLCLVSAPETASWYAKQGYWPTALHEGVTMMVRQPQSARAGGPAFMHADQTCPVCHPDAHYALAAVPAPPLRNPEMGGLHWYHGTHFSPEDDVQDSRAEEFGHHSPDPGGYLEHPEGREAEEESESHWNTGLGVHFTGLHHVAESFANGKGGAWGTTPSHDSRIAHAHLHLANPKDYKDETEMASHAIGLAHSKGQRYFSDHEEDRRKRFESGSQIADDGDEWGGEYEDHQRAQGNLSPHGRKTAMEIDRHGVQPHHTLHDMDAYLSQHPDRESVLHGYMNHLAEHGHDGITYGNEYEGPKGHKCAIVSDPRQIHVRKWQWLHPDHPAHEDPDSHHEFGMNPHATIGDYVRADGSPKTGSMSDHFVRCDQGHTHWGGSGAAGLLLRHTDEQGTKRYLLQQRSPWVDHPETHSTPGGALHPGEHPVDGAFREGHEEMGHIPGAKVSGVHTDDHGGWAYHTVVADVPHQFTPEGDDDHEHGGAGWHTKDEINHLPLHPGFAASWGNLSKNAGYSDNLRPEHREHQDSRKGYNPGDDLSDMGYGNTVGWVKTEHLLPLREFDRAGDHPDAELSGESTAHTKKVVNDIHDELASGRGFTDPFMVKYHHDTHQGSLGEGNHRLASAIRAGVTHVPVRVVRAYKGEAESGEMKPMPGERKTPKGYEDHLGRYRQPDMQHPGEVFPDEALHKGAHVLTDWKPTDRLFAPTKKTLDPRLFSSEKMLPQVRSVLMQKMDGFMSRHGGKDWASWARMYLAGSEASLWWGNNDFDILVGIDYAHFRRATGSNLRDEEITDAFNKAFRVDWNDEDWHPPFRQDETWHLTGYVNPASYDIRAIKPYAAYEVVSDTWFVKPISEPNGHRFDDSFWYLAEGYAEEIRAASELREPSRSNRLARIWGFLHKDRARAFGPNGTGAFDRGNAIEKYLDQAGLWDVLVQGRFGKTAAKTADVSTYSLKHTVGSWKYGDKRYGDEIEEQSPEDLERTEKHTVNHPHFSHDVHRSGVKVGHLSYSMGHGDNGDQIQVKALAIHPAHRGAGLGSALMDQMQRHAHQTGQTIDHGIRTTMGHRWWQSYSKGPSFLPHVHEPDRPDAAPGERATDSHADQWANWQFDSDEFEKGHTATLRDGNDLGGWDHYYVTNVEHANPSPLLSKMLDGTFSHAFTAEGFDHDATAVDVMRAHGLLPTEPLRMQGALIDYPMPRPSRDTYYMSDEERNKSRDDQERQHQEWHGNVAREMGVDPETDRFQVKRAWDHEVRHAIGMGHMTIGEAERHGFRGDGHESGRAHGDWGVTPGSDEERVGGYKPLPSQIHHVTTGLTSVQDSGGLKTRREQGNHAGKGLGGGSDDHISVTSDHGLATDIYHSLHEYHAYLNGKISEDDLTTKHLGGADPEAVKKSMASSETPEQVSQRRRGMTDSDNHTVPHSERTDHDLSPSWGDPHTLESVQAKHGSQWRLKEGAKPYNDQGHYTCRDFERPTTPDEDIARKSEHYKRFSWMRDSHGGHRDPLFMSNDPHRFAQSDPDDFAVLHMHPTTPKAQGYPLRGNGEHHDSADSGEWRVPTGDALQIHGNSRPQPRHEQEQALHDEKQFEHTAASVYGGVMDAYNPSVGQSPERSDEPDENGHHTYYRGINMSGKGSEDVDWDSDESVLNHLTTRNNRYSSKFERGHPKATPFGRCWTTGKELAHKFAVNTASNMGRRSVPQDRSKPTYGAVLEAKTTQPCEEDDHLKGYGEQERKVETNKVSSLTLHLHRLDPEHHSGTPSEKTHVRSIEVPADRYTPTPDEKIAFHKEISKMHKDDLTNPPSYHTPANQQHAKEQYAYHQGEIKRIKAEGSSQGHHGWLPHLDPEMSKAAAVEQPTYYHGTTRRGLTHVLPGNVHGYGTYFGQTASPEHAFATTSQDDAWHYAELAYNHSDRGRPRVYEVEPHNHADVEKDPTHDESGRSRGNMASDVRSPSGFRVVREVHPPEHFDEGWETEDEDDRVKHHTARIHRPAEGPDGEAADGIMIALVPPKRVIDRLPLPEDGEHPSNVHITLLYLGKITDFTKEQVAYLPELIESWAETQKPLKATVQGVGTFSNPGSHVLWAAADIPGGNHMWVSLADTMRSHGYKFAENHGWTPHLTMSYEKNHVRFLPKVERMEFGVREVWCCIGGTWESFRLTG